MTVRAATRLACALAAVISSAWGSLPAEVTVTAPAKFEILNGGRPAGSVGLRVGEKLAVVEAADPYLVVRHRNVLGRVLAKQTDLPAEALPATPATPAAVGPTAATPAAVAPATVAAPAPAPAEPAASAPETTAAPVPFEKLIGGPLVSLQGDVLRPVRAGRLAGVKFFAVYFSASWCGPCRDFTPGLVDAYGKIRALYPEFELILVNRDRSPAEMFAYMRDDRMPWPALAWTAIRASPLNRYAGDGIPCLVLVDENGKVLSDSYRRGRYVGPDAVLDDTWKILRDYRRSHPRPKA